MIISKIIDEYLVKFKDELTPLDSLFQLKKKYNLDKDLFRRDNIDGHITSSAILVSRRSKKMLKIYHEELKQRLQPGGHIEFEDNPLQNAKRILKNLGVVDFTFVPDSENEIIPLDIDTHTIPANSKKKEPEHLHHDFRYLFVCEEEFKIQGRDFVWEDIPELKKYGTYVNLIDKVQFLWSNEYSEKQFYNSVVESLTIPKNTTFIVVQHFLPGVDHFLRSLESIGKVGLAIPKPKSIIKAIKNRVEKIYPVELISREDISKNVFLNKVLNENKRIVFIDIGGWFANHLEKLNKLYPNKIVGVIEDTENGYQKYNNLKELPFPIVSVARSPLKLNEDTLIGQSIVFSADSILRKQNKLIKYMNCGIFGYGKVGKSIAFDLMGKSIKPIVYELNPLRQIEAYNDGCSIGNRNEVLENCDAIFCATGNKSITLSDLSKLNRGTYLFSVTSADDEFELANIDSDYRNQQVDQHVTRYYKFENSFFLVNKGNAVNFIHNAVVGDFIHLVKAEMLFAIEYLNSMDKNNEISEVNYEMRSDIAKIWLKHFHNLEYL